MIQKKYFIKAAYGIVFLSFLLVTIKRIFVGCDVDEMAAFAQAFRIVKGQVFFADIWEAQMTSGMIMALLIKTWMVISGGTTGVVLFVRICSVLLQIIMTVFVYRSLRLCGIAGSLRGVIAGIFYLFCTKKMIVPDYGNLQNWLPILIFLCMLHFLYGDRRRYWLIVIGTLYSLLVLAYPTYLFLVIVYIPGMFLSERETGRKGKDISIDFALLAGTCAFCAIIFCSWILREQSIKKLMDYIGYMREMSGYSIPMTDRLQNYWKQFMEEMKVWIKLALLAAIPYVFLLKRKKGEFRKSLLYICSFYGILIVYEITACIRQDSDWNLRYIVLWTIVGFLLAKRHGKVYFWFGLMPGAAGYLATMYVSVVGLVGAYRAIFPAAFGAMVLMALAEPFPNVCEIDNLKRKRIAAGMITAAFCYLLFCCMGFIRTSNRPQNIFEYKYNVIDQGPLKGILFSVEETDCYQSLLQVSQQYINDEDRLCHMGMNEMVYLMREGQIETAIPSTLWNDWTNAQAFLNYYRVNQEKMPSVIIFNKKYAFCREIVLQMDQTIDMDIMKWVKENYKLEYEDEWLQVYQ